MRKFVLRIILFCLVPLVLLIPLSMIVDKGLQKSRHFYFSEWNDLYAGRIQADMLFMGSSRAWVHFSPQIFDSAYHLNSYNLGLDGTTVDMQLERFHIYLRHNRKPRYIIQEVGLHTAILRQKELPQYAQLLPYLSDTAIWRIYKKQYENASLAERYFPLFKYNNQLPLIKEGILSFLGRGTAATKYKGYRGQLLSWDSSFSNFVRDNPRGYALSIDSTAIDIFKDYLKWCKEQDVKIILVYAPSYYEAGRYITNLSDIKNLISDIAAEYDVPYLDYTENYLDSNKRYFYNSQHLNKEGAEIFSRMVVRDIAPYIKEVK